MVCGLSGNSPSLPLSLCRRQFLLKNGGFAPEASDPHAELHGQRSSDESGRLPLLFESFINSLTLNCGSDVKRCRAGRDGHTG